MKKFFVASALAAVVSVGMMASNAMADGFTFGGTFSALDLVQDGDNDATNDIYETIRFDNPIPGALGSGYVSTVDPTNDPNVSSFNGYIVITDLTLDEGDLYNFSPTDYIGGFQLFSASGVNLLTANLHFTGLVVDNSTAEANSILQLNLTGISTSLTGVNITPLISSFLNAPGGIANLSLIANTDIEYLSKNGGGGAYDGTASPAPEPGVTMLFGLGVVGFAGVIRRRKIHSA